MYSRGKDEPDKVGVRELRQNLSVYLRRIRAGEELVVTERGVPVGKLVPLEPAKGELQRMIDAGLVRVPRNPSFEDWEPLPPYKEGERTLSEILQEMRDEDYKAEGLL
jgi:prevent-host-death family protein